MKTIHNATTRADLLRRVDALRPDNSGQWGKMRVDQMLHHLNSSLELMLGRLKASPKQMSIPKPLFKLLALYVPWRKGKAFAAKELVADGQYDFKAEQTRLKGLIAELAAKPKSGHWVEHPAFGRMTGYDCSRYQYRHVDYHLKQFGA